MYNEQSSSFPKKTTLWQNNSVNKYIYIDILSISIQIPYYPNVRKLYRYYNIFEFINYVMYNVESILLSSYVVWRNDLLNHTMLLEGFILLESFVTPAGISMGIKLRTEFFSHIMSN